VNTVQFQRVARLATIASQVASSRGVIVLNMLLEQAGLNANVKEVRGVWMQTNNTEGRLEQGLVFLCVDVMTKDLQRVTAWLEIDHQDRVVFDVS
jgi:hypothetical protein